MRLGLRMGLNSRQDGGSALDADARLYIAAVETALGTPIATALPSATSNPKRIISDFIKAEKAASRWTLHKRIYLPIYANAAASAIDIVSRNVGTFTASGVTHAAGYVQSDATTGYFDFNATPSGLGLTASSGSFGALLKTAISNHQYLGCVQTSSQISILRHTVTPSIVSEFCNTSTGRLTASSIVNTGIISHRRFSGVSAINQRLSSGRSILISSTQADQGVIPTNNIYALMRNVEGGPPSGGSTSQIGLYWYSIGMSDSDDLSFTDNLKTLWESLTGLTLP